MRKLPTHKADESYDEIVGTSSGSKTEARGSDRRPKIWVHATEKHHHGCHLLVEVAHGEVEGRSERVALCVYHSQEAYDRVPREELWECMRQARVLECYVKSIQDMYKGARKSVRSVAGLTEELDVKVGLHKGSALSPFLLPIIMDMLTKDVKKEAPWDMMFVDDIALCREDKDELEVSLERWRRVFEGRGLKVSWEKTEYLQAGGTEQEAVYLQGEKLKKVDHFKYLGSVVSADGSCEEEIRRRVQAGWQSWRRTSGVLCNRKLSARLKGKIYKCVVRQAILYGMETVAVTGRLEERWRLLS